MIFKTKNNKELETFPKSLFQRSSARTTFKILFKHISLTDKFSIILLVDVFYERQAVWSLSLFTEVPTLAKTVFLTGRDIIRLTKQNLTLINICTREVFTRMSENSMRMNTRLVDW